MKNRTLFLAYIDYSFWYLLNLNILEFGLEEKFNLMSKSYDIDEQIEILDPLNLFYKTKSQNEIEMEIRKDKVFLSALDKFLS